MALGWLAVAALSGVVQPARAQQALAHVRMVATDTLRDVAVTQREGGRSVIYYNPELIARVGPLLQEFFIAHEYGHVYYGHTGGALAEPGSRDEQRRVRQELEADCYAAVQLARSGRTSVEAAIKLFTRMGPFRHDKLHPTGSQRAAKILACLPPVDAASDSGEARAADSADVTMIELTDMARATLHGSVRVSIDGRPVGTLSTVGLTNPLRIRGLRAGEHRYELVVQVFTVDELLTINPSGSVRGGGIVMVERGAPLEVTWAADEAPTLRPATAPARTEAAPR
jgi:hypothetical protein